MIDPNRLLEECGTQSILQQFSICTQKVGLKTIPYFNHCKANSYKHPHLIPRIESPTLTCTCTYIGKSTQTAMDVSKQIFTKLLLAYGCKCTKQPPTPTCSQTGWIMFHEGSERNPYWVMLCMWNLGKPQLLCSINIAVRCMKSLQNIP